MQQNRIKHKFCIHWRAVTSLQIFYQQADRPLCKINVKQTRYTSHEYEDLRRRYRRQFNQSLHALIRTHVLNVAEVRRAWNDARFPLQSSTTTQRQRHWSLLAHTGTIQVRLLFSIIITKQHPLQHNFSTIYVNATEQISTTSTLSTTTQQLKWSASDTYTIALEHFHVTVLSRQIDKFTINKMKLNCERYKKEI